MKNTCKHKTTPSTPCLLLDIPTMRENLRSFSQRLNTLGVVIRPHVKTCKSTDVIREIVRAQTGYHGLTVSTLAEADHFFRAGLNDLLYAVGIAPGKLAAIAGRIQQGMDITIVVDSSVMARQVVLAGQQSAVTFKVIIEIDADGQRAGIRPDHPELPRIAQTLDHPNVRLLGVMTHMGGAYHCRNPACLIEAAKTERDAVVLAAQRLRLSGFECPVVSAGSTPTARFAEDLSGVTEMRIGTYVFQDLVMAGLGVCEVSDIAISVLTEVIGHRQNAGEFLIDAGWMALSRDRGTANHAIDQGYGVVCGENGQPIEDLIVRSADQEHGIVASRDSAAIDLPAYPIGTRLRILPNHACATAAQHRGYWYLNPGSLQYECWPRIGGWA